MGSGPACLDMRWAATALMVALRNPQRFRSMSAFAPIGAPMRPCGAKAFLNYLGPDRDDWRANDADQAGQSRRAGALDPDRLGRGGLPSSRSSVPTFWTDACREARAAARAAPRRLCPYSTRPADYASIGSERACFEPSRLLASMRY